MSKMNLNLKWDLSQAAIARIEKRIAEEVLKNDDFARSPSSRILWAAMADENFARPRSAFDALIAHWIREGKMSWLTADVYRETARDRDELREAGDDVVGALRMFAKHGKERTRGR